MTRPLDPRRVLIFREVARAGSIGAAARTLGWTQPAVSQHLSTLEREAGVPLVLRGPRGVSLTQAGEALLRRADAISAELGSASAELTDLGDLRAGQVRLVAFGSAAATIVPRTLGSFTDEYPGVTVSLSVEEPPEAMAAVARDDADLALVFGYDGAPLGAEGLSWWSLLSEPVHLVTAEHHDAVASLSELDTAPWIGGCERCRSHLLDACRSAGFTPALQHVTDDYVVVQRLVARGLGVAVLPEMALRSHREPGVAVHPLAELGTREVGLVARPGAEAVPAVGALVRHFSR